MIIQTNPSEAKPLLSELTSKDNGFYKLVTTKTNTYMDINIRSFSKFQHTKR
jgi:hypothetical protein